MQAASWKGLLSIIKAVVVRKYARALAQECFAGRIRALLQMLKVMSANNGGLASWTGICMSRGWHESLV
jgi:hypothetical protein